MSIPAKTERPVSAMKEFETMSRACQSMMPKEFAGTVNLMAHPMAGAAAAGALSLGVASHAFGLWMGAMVGTAEASRRALSGALDAEPASERKPAALKLVEKAVAEAPVAVPEPMVEAEPSAPAAAVAKPVGIDRPAAPDDLKAISGIGPKLEKVLNDLGIWTHSQVAALGEVEIAWLDDYLGFSGRIGRDNWLGQARLLADKAGKK